MTYRYSRFAGALIVVSGIVALAPADAAGQSTPAAKARPAARTWTPAKTPWGEPDLQGVYSNRTITPFERPAEFAGKAELTGEETAELERRVADRSADKRDGKGTDADVSRAYNEFWWDRGTKVTTNRSSLIIDPPDGRVPPLTARGAAPGRGGMEAADLSRRRRQRPQRRLDDGSQSVRALHHARAARGDVADAPTTTTIASCRAPATSRSQIEMLGGARIIPTDGGAHVNAVAAAVDGRFARPLGRQHAGRRDDELHEQDALSRRVGEPDAGRAVHARSMPTRSTTSSPSTIRRRLRRPWTASVPYLRTDEQMFEYACHEGNYGMEGILSGARVEEAKQ